MGHYIGITTSRLSVLKLGRVIVLFPRLTQYRLPKSTVIIIGQSSTQLNPQLCGTEAYRSAATRLACETYWNRPDMCCLKPLNNRDGTVEEGQCTVVMNIGI